MFLVLKQPVYSSDNYQHQYSEYQWQHVSEYELNDDSYIASKDNDRSQSSENLHQQKAYLDPRYKAGDFPVAERLAKCVLSLPMHTELDEEQLSYITTNVLQLLDC